MRTRFFFINMCWCRKRTGMSKCFSFISTYKKYIRIFINLFVWRQDNIIWITFRLKLIGHCTSCKMSSNIVLVWRFLFVVLLWWSAHPYKAGHYPENTKTQNDDLARKSQEPASLCFNIDDCVIKIRCVSRQRTSLVKFPIKVFRTMNSWYLIIYSYVCDVRVNIKLNLKVSSI